MELEVDIEEPWPPGDWKDLAVRAAECAQRVAPELDNARLSASLLLTSDREIRALNRDWRERDKPTNVLSFPMIQRDLLESLANSDDGEQLLGDIVLAYETVAREADARAIPVSELTTAHESWFPRFMANEVVDP